MLHRLRYAEDELKRQQEEEDSDNENKMDQDKNEEEDSPFKSTIFLRKLCLFNSASVFDMQREFT